MKCHRYQVLRATYGRHYWRYSWQRCIFLMGQQCHGHADWRRGHRLSPTWKEPHTPLPTPPTWLAQLQEA